MHHKAKRRGALQARDRSKLCPCNDPGSAVHHFVLHRVRETRQFSHPPLAYSRANRKRSELPMTETELKLIAAAATIGLSSKPKAG